MACGLSVCCLTGGRAASRTASILGLYRSVADEIVVAVDERREDALPLLGAVADRLLTFPFEEPGDRPIAWLFASCEQPWILNVDDDEVPGPTLLAGLRGLLSDDVTHCWIARRWLYPDSRTYLAEPPWGRERQLRLVRADSRFLQFSDEFHRPVVGRGPARFVEEPLWHLDTAVNSFEERHRKAMGYERARRGMRIGSFSHNSGLYLPELRPGAARLPVPPDDLALIRRVLEAGEDVAAASGARPERGTRAGIDGLWPGRPWPETLYQARLELAERPPFLVAGVQQTIDVRVENRSDRVWRWGEEGRPAIRLSYRWELDEHEPLRTSLPCDLCPGEILVVPVHVLPPAQAGRHTLELDLVHEQVRWFDRSVRFPIEVRRRRRIAVSGAGKALEQVLDVLFEVPELEPVILRPGPVCAESSGHPQIAGLRRELVGVDAPAPRLAVLWRTFRILAAWRRGPLGELVECELLVIAGPDWLPGAPQSRELWRLAVTLAVARSHGVELLLTEKLAAQPLGPLDRLLRAIIRGMGRTASPEELKATVAAGSVAPGGH